MLTDQETDIETKEKSSHLQVPHVTRADAGEYILTLENEVGTEKVPVKVNVLGEWLS